MEALELDIAAALRSYRLVLRLTVGAETVALVGPSGAGKTTVLRCVAGLKRPDAGEIRLGSQVWFSAARRICLAPERRSVGLVFQEYALFPHMTVRANVAYAGRERVDELLSRLRIAHLAGEKPGAISGGERQRVALARAIARDPAVLLLDEPLAALDAHTRAVVRGELADVLAELRLPALLVTHDFRDATALADRIGVVVDGELRQIGTAAELLRAPADAFVATLSGAAVLPGVARRVAEEAVEVTLDAGGVVRCASVREGRVGVALYPWDVGLSLRAPANGVNAVAGVVGALAPEGDRVRVRLGPLVAERPAEEVAGVERGDRAWATFAPEAARLVRL